MKPEDYIICLGIVICILLLVELSVLHTKSNEYDDLKQEYNSLIQAQDGRTWC